MSNPRAVAIVSGGMDSVTLAHLLKRQGYDLTLVSVDYGQRHAKELGFAAETADRLGAAHHVIDLTSITKLLTGSALTDATIPVPHGHYAAPTMAATVVPNRNATMLCAAVAIAISAGAELVATGVHAGDHAIYPDCRPEFIAAFQTMIEVANEGFLADGFHISAPFITALKADIASLGDQLRVPWDRTWSCYEGGDLHCGRCGTCVERIEAFQLAEITDPTSYQ